MRRLKQQKISTHNAEMEIQKKFSIPVACLVFALLGAVFGLTNQRDAKFASFVKGIAVIFVYYFILMNGQSAAKGGWVPAWLATWIPNVLLGGLGLLLLLRHGLREASWLAWFAKARARLERAWPRLGAWRGASPGDGRGPKAEAAERRPPVVEPVAASAFNILDGYIGQMYLRVFGLTFVGAAGDLPDLDVHRPVGQALQGHGDGRDALQYMWYATPQYVYWCIPLSVLIGSLVTVGILTRTSELIVMRACGISLYRSAAPLLAIALVARGVLFLFEENVLAYSNRRAEELRHVIRGGTPRTFDVLNRKWISGRKGEIYNYVFFDPRRNELNGFSVFRFAPKACRLQSRAFYKTVAFAGKATGLEETVVWQAQRRLGPRVRPAGGRSARTGPSTGRTCSSSRRSTS